MRGYLVEDKEESDLKAIVVRVRNTGTGEITNARIGFDFGPRARLVRGQFGDDLGMYADKVRWKQQDGNKALLEMDHINPSQTITLNFLVSGYKVEDFRVDMAEPGVVLRKTKKRHWLSWFLLIVALFWLMLIVGNILVAGKLPTLSNVLMLISTVAIYLVAWASEKE